MQAIQIKLISTVILLSFLLVILTAGYYGVFTRGQTYADQDFMTLWAGGKALLRGVNPYDEAIWNPIQIEYGSTWLPNPITPYPLWTHFVFVPLALLSVDLAAACWLALSTLALFAILLLLLVLHEHVLPSRIELIGILFAAYISRWTVVTLLNGQISLVLTLVLALFLFLVQRGQPFTAGIVLALIAIKPSSFIIFVPLFGVWLVGQRCWRVIAGGLIGLVVMLIVSLIIQPGWVLAWSGVRDKLVVTAQTPTVWGLAYALSTTWWSLIGLILTVGLTAMLGYFILFWRDLTEADAVSLTVAASLFLTPYAWPYEHALLLIPLILLYSQYRSPIALLAFIAMCTILPWFLFWIAQRRGIDNLSALVPLVIGLCVSAHLIWRRIHQAATSDIAQLGHNELTSSV